jgi:hypothetical protein
MIIHTMAFCTKNNLCDSSVVIAMKLLHVACKAQLVRPPATLIRWVIRGMVGKMSHQRSNGESGAIYEAHLCSSSAFPEHQ